MRPRRSPFPLALAVAVVFLGLLVSREARAQPSRQGYPLPQPAPYYGESYAPAPSLHLLTPQEREILWQGEIGPGQIIGGGLLSAWFGFGIGHAVQGRYSDVGWKFTVGEAAAIGVVFLGASRLSAYESRPDNGARTLILGGALALGVLRIWELVDVLTGPGEHNRRYRSIQQKVNGGYQAPRYGLFVTPGGSKGGGTAGITMRF